ncbi:MAG: acyl-CoA dehydrogenase family protein [Acidimicrobiales bacterium]
MTPDLDDAIALAGRLGRERFAPRAAAYDLEGTFPFENYADLRDHGLLALCVPEHLGGMGARYRDYMLVAAELGRHCGATTLSFNMHSVSVLWSAAFCDDLDMDPETRAAHEERRTVMYRDIVDNGTLYAQPFSEPGSKMRKGPQAWETTATPVEGGWLLNGRKHFASLSGAADVYTITCTEAVPGREPSYADTLFLGVKADSPGFSISGTWDVLGMRATVSRTLELVDVFVPEERQVMPRGIFAQMAQRWPHMFMTLCPTYIGVAQAAFDFTVAYLRGEVPGTKGEPRRSSTTKQLAVAEMRVKLDQAWAMFLRAITEARVDPPRDVRMRAFSTQYTVMELGNEICQLAIRTCGGGSISRQFPLERYYRDSRCGSLMLPWTAEICLERLGLDSLYEPGERDGAGERR